MKASEYFPENILNFPTTKGFRMESSMELAYQNIAIFFTFSTTSNHLHPLQVENCDSNSCFVVDEDDMLNSGLKGLRQVAAHRRFICIGNAISGNGQAASHRMLAAHDSGCS